MNLDGLAYTYDSSMVRGVSYFKLDFKVDIKGNFKGKIVKYLKESILLALKGLDK